MTLLAVPGRQKIRTCLVGRAGTREVAHVVMTCAVIETGVGGAVVDVDAAVLTGPAVHTDTGVGEHGTIQTGSTVLTDTSIDLTLINIQLTKLT